MTRNLRLLILPAILIALSCRAVSAGTPRNCLSYEKVSVQLSGRIVIKTFPGPPNYESIEEGDKPERTWILHLARPICMKADKDFEFNVAESRVSDIHLALDADQFRQLRTIMGEGAVTLTGTLFHRFNAHHHTAVLMRVISILLLQGSPLHAQNAKRVAARITNVSGVKLRESPAINASVVRELGVGDGVEVIRKTIVDAGNRTKELWVFVILVDSRRGDFDSDQKGWVLDKYLGYEDRFKRITSWKNQIITSGIGDYSFTIEIRRDGSFIHKSEPCLDCGEKPGCAKGERKVGSLCVSRGHLYRYNNFVWARKPTEYQEYFFIDKRGKLRSVYPEDR